MGTRGIYGFYKNGIDKLSYNHFDSYPSGLGKDVVGFIQSTGITDMNQIFDNIILVEENSKPTQGQVRECKDWADLDVSSKSYEDWYCLLRESQGDLSAYKNGLKYMIDSKEFIKDSLFCEWGYIINLDSLTFEVYQGFQHDPQHNRYYSEKDLYSNTNVDAKYYNCKLLAEFPLDNIPDTWETEVNKLAYPEGEE